MEKERIFQIGDIVKHFKRETADPESDDYKTLKRESPRF